MGGAGRGGNPAPRRHQLPRGGPPRHRRDAAATPPRTPPSREPFSGGRGGPAARKSGSAAGGVTHQSPPPAALPRRGRPRPPTNPRRRGRRFRRSRVGAPRSPPPAASYQRPAADGSRRCGRIAVTPPRRWTVCADPPAPIPPADARRRSPLAYLRGGLLPLTFPAPSRALGRRTVVVLTAPAFLPPSLPPRCFPFPGRRLTPPPLCRLCFLSRSTLDPAASVVVPAVYHSAAFFLVPLPVYPLHPWRRRLCRRALCRRAAPTPPAPPGDPPSTPPPPRCGRPPAPLPPPG